MNQFLTSFLNPSVTPTKKTTQEKKMEGGEKNEKDGLKGDKKRIHIAEKLREVGGAEDTKKKPLNKWVKSPGRVEKWDV